MLRERISAPWRAWEAIPVFVAALFASVIVSVFLAALTGGIGGLSFQLAVLAFPLALAAFTVLWVGLRYRAVDALRLASWRSTSDLALGGLCGMAIFGLATLAIFPVIYSLWQIVTGHPPSPISQPILPADPTTAQVVVAVLAVVLAAPLGEELFFRGLLFGAFRSRFGFFGAAAFSSVVFALVHIQPQQPELGAPLVLLMFFVGFGLAFMYEWRRSLVAPIAAHAAFNLIGFSLIVLLR